MSLNIAIVGTGPTGLYTLAALIAQETPHLITLYEREGLGGVGMPYAPTSTHAAMLANIASIEIPPICETYLDWLRRQPEAFLTPFGADRETLHDRQFLPRLLLGGYFRDQLETLLMRAEARGHRVALREGAEVTDVACDGDFVRLSLPGGEVQVHDRAILATGHSWPEGDDGVVFLSPWTGLPGADIAPGRIGILGTSLSGIDAALSVALQHGAFRDADDGLAFDLDPGADGLSITLMSRGGLLPEADFYCPIPYEPLSVLTPEVLEAETRTQPGLLNRLFAHFAREIEGADAAFADRIGLSGLDADSFAGAYFALREGRDPFELAAENLAEVRAKAAKRVTVPWKYAILRLHEAFDAAVPRFDAQDLTRFDAGLKRVFVDNYAAVPPLSIERLMALHRAGILSVAALGESYRRRDGATHVTIRADGARLIFDTLIDARGQLRLSARDLPFATLRAALGEDDVPLDDNFRVCPPGIGPLPLWLPAAPYLLHRRPFAQGITESAAMGAAVAASVLGSAVGMQATMIAAET